MMASRPACIAAFAIALSASPYPRHGTYGQATAGDAATSPAPAPSAAVQVTTDTREYCDALARRIDHERAERLAGAAKPPIAAATAATAATPDVAEVTLLTGEGQRMCDKGLLLGGIARLRRAWMLLHPHD